MTRTALVLVLGASLSTGILSCGWPFSTADRRDALEDRLPEFQLVVDRYEALQQRGELGESRLSEKRGKILIDPGPPLRIAFRDGKVADIWAGFVYDPSGEVLKVGELRREAAFSGRAFHARTVAFEDPDGIGRIVFLFGGAMCNSVHLRGDWYWCAFN